MNCAHGRLRVRGGREEVSIFSTRGLIDRNLLLALFAALALLPISTKTESNPTKGKAIQYI